MDKCPLIPTKPFLILCGDDHSDDNVGGPFDDDYDDDNDDDDDNVLVRPHSPSLCWRFL